MGNRNFHFPSRKLWGKCLFPQNFQHKEYGEMLSIFTVKGIDFPDIGISNGINNFYNFGIRNIPDFRDSCVRSMVLVYEKLV